MKVYIAAPWARKAEAREAAKLIQAEGWVVTSSWLNEEDRDYGPPGYYGATDWRGTDHAKDLAERALQDLKDITRSDLLLLLNLEPSEGKTVETGVAIAEQMGIIVVGKPTNVFHYLPDVVIVHTVQEAINVFNG